MTDEGKRNGGYMEPQKMISTYDIVTSAFTLDKTKDSASNLYTNNFLK